jgi:hypothetical protein
MLANPIAQLPEGPGASSPSGTGFRSIVFRDGDQAELGSRNDQAELGSRNERP